MTEWLTFAAVIAGFLFQLYREERKRKWEVEDRARIEAALIAEAQAVALKVEASAQGVADKVVSEAKGVARKVIEAADAATEERHKLAVAMDANTAISTKAFHEANTVNQKLEALGVEHNALQRREQDAVGKSELIAETVVDTQSRVKRIEKEVTDGGVGGTDSR